MSNTDFILLALLVALVLLSCVGLILGLQVFYSLQHLGQKLDKLNGNVVKGANSATEGLVTIARNTWRMR